SSSCSTRPARFTMKPRLPGSPCAKPPPPTASISDLAPVSATSIRRSPFGTPNGGASGRFTIAPVGCSIVRASMKTDCWKRSCAGRRSLAVVAIIGAAMSMFLTPPRRRPADRLAGRAHAALWVLPPVPYGPRRRGARAVAPQLRAGVRAGARSAEPVVAATSDRGQRHRRQIGGVGAAAGDLYALLADDR